MQTEFQREETVVLNLTVRNIALTPKLATVIVTVYDVAAYPITYIEKENLVFQPVKVIYLLFSKYQFRHYRGRNNISSSIHSSA